MLNEYDPSGGADFGQDVHELGARGHFDVVGDVLERDRLGGRAGWRRDFVLVGDGWEKDGDYNTGHSQTVLPLPAHSRPDYGSLASAGALEDDPVFQRHKADWETFHTRYVRPTAFVEGLRALGAERRR